MFAIGLAPEINWWWWWCMSKISWYFRYFRYFGIFKSSYTTPMVTDWMHLIGGLYSFRQFFRQNKNSYVLHLNVRNLSGEFILRNVSLKTLNVSVCRTSSRSIVRAYISLRPSSWIVGEKGREGCRDAPRLFLHHKVWNSGQLRLNVD